jgi:hypothetical protein
VQLLIIALQPIHAVQTHIADASVASHAGTELSMRLPRDAVSQFPDMFEALERESAVLGVRSYGIETTTLEEVFMRIVNEDTEELLADPAAASEMLGASHEERQELKDKLAKRDEQRHPMDDAQLKALLTRGTLNFEQSCTKSVLPQVPVMMQKRFRQFYRSKGQWNLNVFFPLLLIVLCGLLIRTSPTKLLKVGQYEFRSQYGTGFPTLLAGPNEALANAQVDASIGDYVQTIYVGGSYSSLYDTVLDSTDNTAAQSTATGIYVEAVNNFTVMYNASYPTNLAASVQMMLEYAVLNATNDMLSVDQTYGMLPSNELVNQVRLKIP